MSEILSNFWLRLIIAIPMLLFVIHYRYGVGNIINVIQLLLKKGIKGRKTHHLNDAKILKVVEHFDKGFHDEAISGLQYFNPTYQDFTIRAIGDLKNTKELDEAISKSPNNTLYLILQAYSKMKHAWDLEYLLQAEKPLQKDIVTHNQFLLEAKQHLEEARKTPCEYEINKIIGLLMIHKSIKIEDRNTLHDLFNEGLQINATHIGLHMAYSDVISLKWGGSTEEFENYMDQLPEEPLLLETIIFGYYYIDFLIVYGNDDDGTIQEFLIKSDQMASKQTSLYRYHLYFIIYTLSAHLGIKSLEEKYKELTTSFINV